MCFTGQVAQVFPHFERCFRQIACNFPSNSKILSLQQANPLHDPAQIYPNHLGHEWGLFLEYDCMLLNSFLLHHSESVLQRWWWWQNQAAGCLSYIKPRFMPISIQQKIQLVESAGGYNDLGINICELPNYFLPFLLSLCSQLAWFSIARSWISLRSFLFLSRVTGPYDILETIQWKWSLSSGGLQLLW